MRGMSRQKSARGRREVAGLGLSGLGSSPLHEHTMVEYNRGGRERGGTESQAQICGSEVEATKQLGVSAPLLHRELVVVLPTHLATHQSRESMEHMMEFSSEPFELLRILHSKNSK